MVEQDRFLVEVLYGTQMPAGGCSGCAGCGTTCTPDDQDANQSSVSDNYQEATRMMEMELHKVFGDRVEVRYVNVDDSGLDEYPLMKRVLVMGYPYPITLINGKPKFAGAIMTRDVIESLQQEIK
ncbi:MAG TPA: hypothetical protein GX404_06640 [Syntrophomonadaceae bacterium]|nr:hypothetical protein [Syntrophomonadaceae bacterium]